MAVEASLIDLDRARGKHGLMTDAAARTRYSAISRQPIDLSAMTTDYFPARSHASLVTSLDTIVSSDQC